MNVTFSPESNSIATAGERLGVGNELVREQISAYAENRGLTLSQDRLERLIDTATRPRDEDGLAFDQDGLQIGYPGGGFMGLGKKAEMDFRPSTTENPNGTSFPTPEDATHIALTGLRAVQDFVILAETGNIPNHPKRFVGLTNPEMARVVTSRLGFNGKNIFRDPSLVRVWGRIEDISAIVFSPNAHRLDRAMARRLGHAAVAQR